MNYKYIISFLATEQQKMWYKPSGRLILFEDDIDSRKQPVENQFASLLEAYPEIWKVHSMDSTYKRIASIDGSPVKWYHGGSVQMARMTPMPKLAIESPIYIYDTVTQSIIFNNDGLSKEKLEEWFPDIEKFIDSGAGTLKLK